MSGAALVLVAAATAAAAWRMAAGVEPEPQWRMAAAALLWWGLLLVPFHILGAIWLAAGWAVVDVRVWAALVLVLVAGVLATAPRPFDRGSVWRTGVALQERVTAGLAIAALGLLVVSTLSAPPRGFDALWYHLPAALHWIQTGGLGVGLGAAHQFYPGNGELLVMPLVALANDSWAGLVQLPALIAVGLFAALLARRGPRVALAAAVVTLPVSLEQASRAYVDLLVAAFLLGGLLFAERWLQRGTRADLALASLGAGLALGTKYIAIAPAGLLWLGLLWAGGSRGAGSERLKNLAVLIAGTCPAWIWWLRNLVIAGDPLRGSAAGIVVGSLLSGRLPATIVAPDRGDGFVAVSSIWWSAFGLLLLVALAGLAAAARAGSDGRWKEVRVAVGGVAAAALAVAALGVLMPLTEPRFWIAPVVLAAALAVRALHRRSPAVAIWLLTAVVAINVGTFAAVQVRTNDFDHAWLRVDRNELYGLPAAIDDRPDGSVVLTVGHPTMEYPAAGRNRGNRVLASPRGDLDTEIDRWAVDYVLVRLDEDELASIASNRRLAKLGERSLPAGRWWDTLGEDRPRRTVLFEVRER
jgi:hypothetical protein